jgi:DNA-binding transcriptional MerR regulator
MSSSYRIGKFAKLAGVTVRALHHYDRIGLLKPQRGSSGIRLYRLEDLERLEQIAALKFLGIPLQEIKLLLKHGPLTLVDSLRVQREALAEKRKLIDRAIVAIEAAEKVIQSGQTTDAPILRKIIAVIDMQPQENFMRKYYTDQAWLDKECIVHQTPPEARQKNMQAWQQLFAEAAIDLDPASAPAQALTKRWLQLAETANGGNGSGQGRQYRGMERSPKLAAGRTRQASGQLRSRSTRQNRLHAARRDSDKIHREDNWPQGASESSRFLRTRFVLNRFA